MNSNKIPDDADAVTGSGTALWELSLNLVSQFFIYLKIAVLYLESFPSYIKFFWAFPIYQDFKSLFHTDSSDFQSRNFWSGIPYTQLRTSQKKAVFLSALALKCFTLVNIEVYVIVLGVDSWFTSVTTIAPKKG